MNNKQMLKDRLQKAILQVVQQRIDGCVDLSEKVAQEKIELEQRKDSVRKKLNDLSVRLEEARRIDAPCCCYDCDSEIQSGHFACEEPPLKMLEMEESGEVSRSYQDGRWSWYYEPS